MTQEDGRSFWVIISVTVIGLAFLLGGTEAGFAMLGCWGIVLLFAIFSKSGPTPDDPGGQDPRDLYGD